ncbi:esterase [Fragilaria crotonensis]|nr:esterase [Fragilaria crotonensis]
MTTSTPRFLLLPVCAILLLLLESHQSYAVSFDKIAGTNTLCDVGPDVMTIAYGPFTEGVPITQYCIKNPVENGKPRCYYLLVPKCASGDVPLVVNMHGSETCPAWSSFFDQWIKTAVRNCFALALPIGVTDPDVADHPCMTFPGGRSVNGGMFTTNNCCCYKDHKALEPGDTLDMIFIRNIVQDIAFEKRVDSSATIHNGTAQLDGTRIYMTGHSNGCVAALAMGALYSNMVAAIACHAAGGFVEFPSYYDPVPTMLVQGMKDDVMWYQFARDTALNLQSVHDCKTDSATQVFNGTGVEYAYQDCKNNATVNFLLLNESGHIPFLNAFEVSEGASRTTVDTTQRAWEFCSNYTKDEMPKALLYASSAMGRDSIMWSPGGLAVAVMTIVSILLC